MIAVGFVVGFLIAAAALGILFGAIADRTLDDHDSIRGWER